MNKADDQLSNSGALQEAAGKRPSRVFMGYDSEADLEVLVERNGPESLFEDPNRLELPRRNSLSYTNEWSGDSSRGVEARTLVRDKSSYR